MKKLIILICLTLTFTGCNVSDLPFMGGQETPEFSLEYQPPFVPVTFVLNEEGITLEGGVSMVTPIGRFGVGVDYPVAEFGQMTLVLRDRTAGEDNVYHVVVEDEVRILIDGQAEISLNREGVLTVDITEGELQAISFTNEEQPVGIASAQRLAVPPVVVSLSETGEVELSQ